MARIPNFALALLLGANLNIAAANSICDSVPQTEPASAEELKERKVEIEADQIEFPERNIVHLKGFTQLMRGGHRVYADELVYNKESDEVEATGVVKFQTPQGDTIETSILRYDIAQNRAVSGPADFVFASRLTRVLGSGNSSINAHGTAKRVIFEGKDIMRLEGAVVTTCLDGKDDMTFTADDITVDLKQGVRAAHRAKLQILAPERHKRLRELVN